MKPVKIVVSGYIGFDNFGDESILDVLLDNLKRQNTEITVITANPSKTKLIHGVKTCKTFALFSILRAILRSDALISGGGSLLQDKTSIKSLLYYLFIILCAQFCGKKVIIFAQGIGPLKRSVARFLTKIILKSCDLLSVRDEKSLFLLRGWGIAANLQPDPVFNLDIPDYTPLGKVGIQLRSWKYLSEDFLNKLADEVINNFADKEVLIFSFQDELDYTLCKEFQTKLTIRAPHIKTNVIKNDYPHNIVENFRTLEYLIGMRFHACLLALKFGIKTLAINYDEKVEKLAKSANLPIANLDKPELLENLFEELKSLKTSVLFAYANTKRYDFSEINALVERISTLKNK